MCGALPGRCLHWNLDVTQCFLSCPALTNQALPLGPGSCGRAEDQAKGRDNRHLLGARGSWLPLQEH